MLQFQPLSAARKTVEADVTDTFNSEKDWVDVTIPATFTFSSQEGCSWLKEIQLVLQTSPHKWEIQLVLKTSPHKWEIQLVLLGSSGGVVNSLDFCLASLKSLGCFYFFTLEDGDSEFANFTLPTLKAFLEARSQNVSGNKQ